MSLGSNEINTIDELKELSPLKELIQLDLSGTDVANLENYRKDVFELFPKLQILDNLDKDGNSIEYSDDEDEDYSEEEGEEEEFHDDDYDDDEEQDEGDEDYDDEGNPIKKLKVA